MLIRFEVLGFDFKKEGRCYGIKEGTTYKAYFKKEYKSAVLKNKEFLNSTNKY